MILSDDVTTLLGCLNEFPEFSDDALNTEIRSFETDLKVTIFQLHLVSI